MAEARWASGLDPLTPPPATLHVEVGWRGVDPWMSRSFHPTVGVVEGQRACVSTTHCPLPAAHCHCHSSLGSVHIRIRTRSPLHPPPYPFEIITSISLHQLLTYGILSITAQRIACVLSCSRSLKSALSPFSYLSDLTARPPSRTRPLAPLYIPP